MTVEIQRIDIAPSPSKLATFVVIGNPENRRVSMFVDAASSLGHSARIHSYESWLGGDAPKFQTDEILRIESPGENQTVENALIKLGEPHLTPSSQFGVIQHHQAWFAGFSKLLQQVSDQPAMNSVPDILSMFDKIETHERLARHGVRQPARIDVTSWDDLKTNHNPGRFFIKPRFGSSASGVIALSLKGDRTLARTSIEKDGEFYFNRLNSRELHDPDEIRDRVDFVQSLDFVVERWVPKATLASGETFDLRVVCIDGAPTHVVVRKSIGPITNLHLGNARGTVTELLDTFGRSTYQDALEEAARAARCFASTHYCGVDVAILSSGKPVVFEVNAFGDLVPGVQYDGNDTYAHEVKTFMERHHG